MNLVYLTAIGLFIFVCLLLCAVILLQESKNMGLGSSFGGDAGSSMFGTSTADVLRRFTGWLACVFLVSCVLLSIWTTQIGHKNANGEAFNTEIIEGE